MTSTIDIHAHSLNPQEMIQAFNLNKDMHFQPHRYLFDHSKTMDETMDKTVLQYDKNNISIGVLSGPHTKSWIDRYPDKFLHSTVINFSGDLEEQVTKFEENVNNGKTHALGEIGIPYAGFPLDTEIMYPFYEICERYEIPVSLHTGINGPHPVHNMPHWDIRNGDPLLFEKVLHSFPKLNVIFAHFGYPFTDHTIYMLSSYKRVHADISVINWMLGKSLFQRMITEAVETVGSDRILFGSDQMIWPEKITTAIENTRFLPLSNEDKENIFYKGSARLLKI